MKRLGGDSGQAGAASLMVLGLGLLCGTSITWLSGVSTSTAPARGLTALLVAAGLLGGLAFIGRGFQRLTIHRRHQAQRRESEVRLRQRIHERLGLVPVDSNGDGEDNTQAGQALELTSPATPWAEEQIT